MSPRRSKRTSRRLKLCRWAKVRSTTQRHAPEPGAVLGLAAGDHGLDARARAGQPAVLVVVVAAVGDHACWAGEAAGRPATAGTASKQRDQLGDVVAIAAGERPGERDPCSPRRGGGAWSPALASVNRARARLGAPFLACIVARVDDRPATTRAHPPPAAAASSCGVQALPHPGLLPLVQPPPAGDPGAEAELLRQMLSRRSRYAARTGSHCSA